MPPARHRSRAICAAREAHTPSVQPTPHGRVYLCTVFSAAYADEHPGNIANKRISGEQTAHIRFLRGALPTCAAESGASPRSSTARSTATRTKHSVGPRARRTQAAGMCSVVFNFEDREAPGRAGELRGVVARL